MDHRDTYDDQMLTRRGIAAKCHSVAVSELKKDWEDTSLCLPLQLSEFDMGKAMWVKNAWEKIVPNFYFSWTVNYNKYAVLATLSSTLLRTKKKTVKKSEIWVKFFTIGCVFYRVGDRDDLQIDQHISLHDGFKI